MAGLWLPDNRLLTPSLLVPSRSPVSQMRVDWSHPDAGGLALYGMVVPEGAIDLAHGCDVTLGSGVELRTAPEGLRLFTTIDDVYAVEFSGYPEFSGTGDFTMIVRVGYYGSGATADVTYQAKFGATPGGTNGYCSIKQEAVNLRAEVRTYANYGTTAFTTDEYNTSHGQSEFNILAVRRHGSVLSYFRNGVLIESYSGTVRDIFRGSGTYFAMGYGQTIGEGSASVGMLYSRALSNAAIARLSCYPYAILVPS